MCSAWPPPAPLSVGSWYHFADRPQACAALLPPRPPSPPAACLPASAYRHPQIVQAVNDYTKALQEGLKLIGSS